MSVQRPTMHCQSELEDDLGYEGFISDKILHKWFNDNYSSSKHLLTLYSIARGLNAKTILEIGFGRSSFVLARAAVENNGKFITCDQRDFSYLLNKPESEVTDFIHGKSDMVWDNHQEGIDFAFLDYFSSPSITSSFVSKEINFCIARLKQNGIIAIHDSIVEKYNIKSALNGIKTNWSLFHNREVEIMSLPFNYGLAIIRKVGSSSYGKLEDSFKTKKPEV
mgnify:CR=1 FL=1